MIDWQLLVEALSAVTGASPARPRVVPMSGGNINRAFRLESGSFQYFVKLNQADRESMFVAEREGLDAIRNTGSIRVPQVYLTGSEHQHSYIVLEYIEMSADTGSIKLARALAAMHACTGRQFGFHCDNTIGSTAQVNSPGSNWPDFWREHRLAFQLELAEQNGMPARLIESGGLLALEFDRFFYSYQPRASLLHGDLWAGNHAADSEGNPVLYDPACYYGDHEADLAMMELFGNPGDTFFAAYRECFPVDEGYALRRDLYNLYHLLNHANLFGGSYADQAQRVIDKLLAQLH